MKQIMYCTLLVGIMFSCKMRTAEKAYDMKTAIEVAVCIQRSFSDSITNERVYPSYFGGLYLDTLTQQCVVNVIGDTVSAKKDLIKRCKSDNFVIKQVNASLSKLMELIYRIEDYLGTPIARELTLHGVLLDEMRNNVVVVMENLSPEMLGRFRQTIVDSPYIIFEYGTGMVFEQEIYPIDWI